MGILQSSARKKEYCVPCPHGYAPGNPGTFGEVNKKALDLHPLLFEGIQLNVTNRLSQHFSSCHMINLSSVTPSGYKFRACYKGSKAVGPDERYPEIIGDLMPNGDLAATFIHTLGCRLRLKHRTQMSKGQCLSSSSTAEYRRDDLTVAVRLDDLDVLKSSGILVFHYLQAFTPRLTMGVEVAAFRRQDVPGGQRSRVTGAIRYSTGIWTGSATMGHDSLLACYHHKASQQLQLGVIFKTNFARQESVGTIVYQFDVPHADMIFKGLVDTNTMIGGVFEKKLYPVPGASLLLSCMLNHDQQQIRVGIGLNVG